MRTRAGLAVILTALSLQACAATQAETPRLTPSPPAFNLSALPGWAVEDHVAALGAVRAACVVTTDMALRAICRQAAALDFVDESGAREFLETNFRAAQVGDSGRLTAYFTPVYVASRVRAGEFTAPVRPPPIDLPTRDANATAHAPYADRGAIDARPAPDALAWMRPEDLFFMQIQGSGVLTFAEGEREKAVFAGHNGAPFVGIAAPMRERGLLTDQDTSGEAIRAWLAQHRGPEADAIMQLDPRYVFFRLTRDDGADPVGAAGTRLAPGRSIAVDPAFHAMGDLLWLDASAPVLAGAYPAYRRLAVALDTGGAIKGPVRADLYLGRGPAAGLEAGRVRHALSLFRLVPVARPGP